MNSRPVRQRRLATTSRSKRKLDQAFRKGDASGILALLSPDVEWSEPENPFNPAGGTRRGEAGFREWLLCWPRVPKRFSCSNRGSSSRVPTASPWWGTRSVWPSQRAEMYETDFVHVVTFRDNKIIRFQEFFDTFAAAEAFRPGGGRP